VLEGRRRVPSPGVLLIAVCVLHALSSLLLVGIHHGYGADETVYLSQINRFVPADYFTAPRARGPTFVVAPVTLLTTSLAALRIWLAVVTSVLMYAGFRPWLRLVQPYLVPLAAFLFTGLWTTAYYGLESMPNIYVALLAVPAVALVVDWVREPGGSRRRLIWLAGLAAGLALFRPSDAAWMLVPVTVVALCTRGLARRARLWLAGAVAGGLVAGLAEWVIEAYVRFGSLGERLHEAAVEQGPGGVHFSLLVEARALNGPLVCRVGCHLPPLSLQLAGWWLVMLVLVAAGLSATRGPQRLAMRAAAVAGLAVLSEYVFTIYYAAPRFLMPMYALLAIPAAAGLVALLRLAPATWRPAAVGLAGVAVGAQLVAQGVALHKETSSSAQRSFAAEQAVAGYIRHHLADGRPCQIRGWRGTRIAYLSGCGSFGPFPDQQSASAPVVDVFLAMSRGSDPVQTGWTMVVLHPVALNHPLYLSYAVAGL
jgi:hypothetical protein